MEDRERQDGELMRRMVEAFNTGDLSSVDSLVSASYVDHQGIGGSEIYGPGGFAEVVRSARQAHPRLRVDILELTVKGDTVEARLFWYEPGQAQGSNFPTPHERRTIEIVRFACGLAVEHWGEQLC